MTRRIPAARRRSHRLWIAACLGAALSVLLGAPVSALTLETTPAASPTPTPSAAAKQKPKPKPKPPVVHHFKPPPRPHPHGTPPPKRPHPRRKPWPVTITVQTVPVLAGVRLSWDGRLLQTDAQGRARVSAEHNLTAHTLTVIDAAVDRPGRQYRFVRWAGQRDPLQAYRPVVTGLPMRANYLVTAGFSVRYPVQARFVDQHGSPVDRQRIAAVTIRTDTGKVVNFPTSGPIWLDGSLPALRGSTLWSRTASYSLHSVMVNGTNTVDVGQQTFQPAQEKPLVFSTKFFDLTVQAHDVLFKARTGRFAQVVFPDGSTHQVPFGPDGSGHLFALPRGVYTVDVPGSGSTLASQITLSRNVNVDIVVATRRDLIVLAAGGLVLAIGLILLGRSRRRPGLFRALLTSVSGRLRRSAPGADRGRRPQVQG